MAQTETKSLGDKLLSIPKWALFLVLAIGTTLPLFANVALPNKPDRASEDLFNALNSLKEGDTVIIQSDWTESTRGENRGHFDAMLRILTRRGVKFAMLSVADPQAPQVARNVVRDINIERKAAGEREYVRWQDWIDLGYFPNGEGLGQAMAVNLRDAVGQKRDTNPADGGRSKPVFESPVLKDVKNIGDVDMYVIVTGTKSIIIALERLYGKVPIAGMVTGVMGPETNNYYVSGQLVGMAAGLKGVYDVESLMEREYKGKKNLDKGNQYILTLHVAIGLLILAVVLGNVGVALTRGRSK